MKRCILVLSSPRSGSSCLMACLKMSGVFLGNKEAQVKDRHNVKGYFENASILTFNEKVLRNIESGIFDEKLLNPAQTRASMEFKKELKDLITEEYGEHSLIGIKDMRIVTLFELYQSALKELEYNIDIIEIKRNADASAHSMSQMIPGVSFKQGKNVHEKFHNGIQKLPYEKILVKTEEFMADPVTSLTEICDALKIPPATAEEVNAFVDVKLLHCGGSGKTPGPFVRATKLLINKIFRKLS